MERRELYQQVAQLHLENINQGFIATLGVGFISLMYQAIDEAGSSVLLVEQCDGRVIAFVAGGLGMGAIYKQMLRSPFRLTLALLPSVLRPRRVLRILEILRHSSGHRLPPNLPEAELLSISVDPAYRGRGVAERLYHELENYFRTESISSFKIIVGAVLEPAHGFYRRMGAISETIVEVHQGERSLVYVQQLVGGFNCKVRHHTSK